jgi:uncharacterized protein (DUF169 family)
MTPFPFNSWTLFRDTLGLTDSPVGIYYTHEKPQGRTAAPGGHVCMIGLVQNAVKKGEVVYFDKDHFGCPGGAYYMGLAATIRPHIEYFLSCGIPGEMEGERYIKRPEKAREYFDRMKPRPAPAPYCVFKPLEQFGENERPEVVAFFAAPDLLAGLFTLTNYSLEVTDGVSAPFGSGCSSIVTYPLHEADKKEPRATLGMFDVSARPMVGREVLTFAIPYALFLSLLENVNGSFLETESWKKVLRRIRS